MILSAYSTIAGSICAHVKCMYVPKNAVVSAFLLVVITDRIYFYNKSFAVRHLFKVCKLWTVADDDDDYATTTASPYTSYCVLIFVILMAIRDFSSFPSVFRMIFCNIYHNLPQQTSCLFFLNNLLVPKLSRFNYTVHFGNPLYKMK